MNILFTILDMNNFGGITADLELKCKGLRAAGHKVSLVMLRDSPRVKDVRKTLLKGGPEGSYPSEFGDYKDVPILANADFGWYNIPTIGYTTPEGLKHWKQVAAKFDVIFHEIPGPAPDADGYWRKVYEVKTKQILIVHDAHFREMYPHLIDIAHKLEGVSCTNPAGYNGLSWFPAPRAFVGAPHPVLNWKKQPRWADRKPIGVAAHMWKAWKHQDAIIRAIPLMKKSRMIMAGDGIERRYMTSKDKCPPAFEGIWQAAVDSGRMKYTGMLQPDRLFKAYQNSRVMVDMSWSDKFNTLGNHFNRSIIEGYNNGVVPICVDMNMAEKGMQRRIFTPGKTHFEISHKASPKELAQLIDHVANLKEDDAMEIVEAGRKILLRHFDYRKASLDFLKLAEGKPCGIYPKLETGKLNRHIKLARDLKVEGKPTATIKAAILRSVREAKKK